MRCRVTQSPEAAAEALRSGNVVALPTETVYGLGGCAFDVQAVAQIFAVKERPTFDPLIVHVSEVEQLRPIVSEFPAAAERLAARFWPGPLTLVLPKTAAVPDLVTSGLPTVAVRIPAHPLIRRVIDLVGAPIAAPSANLFGRLSPTSVEHVLEQLGDRIDLVLDGGACTVGVESTIVQIRNDEAVLLRPGGVPLEELTQVVQTVLVPDSSSETSPAAPGRLAAHYAPRTPIQVVDVVPNVAPASGVGVLVPSPRVLTGYDQIEVLSETGDLVESASRFFQALHRLDRGNLQLIIAQRFADIGLGRALNDRLQRAAETFRS